MQTHADRVITEILCAEGLFLIEIGRLTLLFSRIEDCLVNDARELVRLSEDEKLKEEAAEPALLRLRVLEKRDFRWPIESGTAVSWFMLRGPPHQACLPA